MKILLLGGTSETATISTALAERGLDTLVSTATDAQLDIGAHPRIRRRMGRLDGDGMKSFIAREGVDIIVDATHPFATEARKTARAAADAMNIEYVTYVRPNVEYNYERIIAANSHEEAAVIVFKLGCPVLLTTGSRNLAPYVREARRAGVELYVRILPHEESSRACEEAGIDSRFVIAARGPFSVDENLEHIRKFNIGAIVTKDSGAAGGVPEKIEAAKITGCHVVLIRRPENPVEVAAGSVDELMNKIDGLIAKRTAI